MSVKTVSFAAALLAGLGLAACTNGRPDVNALTLAKAAVSRKPAPVVEDPAQVAAAVNEALVKLDGPLALATFEKTKNNVILRQIETNGAYRTWTSWGGGERRSVTTRNGIVTATRGLRHDLMSSDIGQTLSLVSGRSAGSAIRIQRYLDGSNQIVERRFDCSVSRGGPVTVQAGSLNRSATQMTESCQDADHSFRNIYHVDSAGRILASVQWLNDFYGTTVVQQLR